MGVRASIEGGVIRAGPEWSLREGRGGAGRGGWQLPRGGPGSDRKLSFLFPFRL